MTRRHYREAERTGIVEGMKLLDLALTGLLVLSVTVFLAYLGLRFDAGLFTTLPDGITGFFLALPALEFVALGSTVAALTAKLIVGRKLKRQEQENRI
jgi:hypothetical protein